VLKKEICCCFSPFFSFLEGKMNNIMFFFRFQKIDWKTFKIMTEEKKKKRRSQNNVYFIDVLFFIYYL